MLRGPNLQDSERTLLEWQEEKYEKNPLHPEQLTVETRWGEKVRSKSERDIYHLLKDKRLPFCYERAFLINGRTIYPDFIIRHPKTGQLFIWEHFGLMDDSEYRAKALRKLQWYIEAGWIPGVNLIITMETKDHPMSAKHLFTIVEEHFG